MPASIGQAPYRKRVYYHDQLACHVQGQGDLPPIGPTVAEPGRPATAHTSGSAAVNSMWTRQQPACRPQTPVHLPRAPAYALAQCSLCRHMASALQLRYAAAHRACMGPPPTDPIITQHAPQACVRPWTKNHPAGQLLMRGPKKSTRPEVACNLLPLIHACTPLDALHQPRHPMTPPQPGSTC